MKALTISQPYASLIASGSKFVENRTWPTLYRGEIAIHAGKGTQYMTKKEMRTKGMPIGQVVAYASIEGCIELASAQFLFNAGREEALKQACHGELKAGWLSVERFLQHEHTEGPWCWIIGDVRKLEYPIHAKGSLGLWNWERPKVASYS